MNRRMLPGAAIAIALAVAGWAALSHTTNHESTPTAATEIAPAATAPGEASLRAYIDPETGEMTVGVTSDTPLSLDPATENALRRDSEGLVPVRHADGSVSVNLQGRYQSVSAIHITEDGSKIICNENADAVHDALNGQTDGQHTPEVE
jgi:hypothetical protein